MRDPRGITIEAKADPLAKFRGERQDLEEMAGNLVDNACKWAASQVFIEVLVNLPAAPGAGTQLRIIVDDDGCGPNGRPNAPGFAARPAARRVQSWVPGWGVHRGRFGRPLRREPFAPGCTDRRPSGRNRCCQASKRGERPAGTVLAGNARPAAPSFLNAFLGLRLNWH